MIQLSILMWTMAVLFGYIGFTRGWNKEAIATAGIILGLFALNEFDDVIEQILITSPPDQQFFFRAALFGLIVFFAYQTRALIGEDAERTRSRRSGGRGGEGRDYLQSSMLGAIVGFINGYLIWGSLWYFMYPDYPLSPYISRRRQDRPARSWSNRCAGSARQRRRQFAGGIGYRVIFDSSGRDLMAD
jgi:hypothetical protein